MELYLDSANIAEIKEAFKMGSITGLTTTPTFMHKEGVKNLDEVILDLSRIVPILQIEALGKDSEEIVAESNRLIDLGLDPKKTVFKIPVSLEGIKACDMLVSMGRMVNIHLVYTLQQAYMAMVAGATYICPLVGRLQDQGQDALQLVAEAVEVVDRYSYNSKIMFSSVRNAEHIRNALQTGAHACTVPWKIMQKLTDNYLTTIGTKEFFEHNNLIMMKVSDLSIRSPKVNISQTLNDGLVQMSISKLGAVAILDDENNVRGIFTDGDLRRLLSTEGNNLLDRKFDSLSLKPPISIRPDESLQDALSCLQSNQLDTLVVVDNNNQYVGMLDIQDILSATEA